MRELTEAERRTAEELNLAPQFIVDLFDVYDRHAKAVVAERMEKKSHEHDDCTATECKVSPYLCHCSLGGWPGTTGRLAKAHSHK